MARVPPHVAFAVCTLIWGTTWIAIKIGYTGLDPIWAASLRFLLATLLLVPLIGLNGLPPPRGTRQITVVLVVGLVLFGADYGLIYWGEQALPSGLTSILFATMPLSVAIFGAMALPQERITVRHLAGIVVGIGGLLLIFLPEALAELSARQAGASLAAPMLAIVASAACAGLSSVVVRRWGQDLDARVLNGSAMFVGAAALWAASRLLGETQGLPSTGAAWGSLLYLVVLGSVVSFFLYWGLLRVWTANRAGLIPVATPVVALLTGLVAGERLTVLQWIGSLIVLGGVALALAPWPAKSRAPKAAEAPAK